MRKRSYSHRKEFIVFAVLYAVGALGAAIMGLLSESFFAYDVVDAPWATALYFVFISMLYITAFVSELFNSRKPFDITANAFIFLGSLAMAITIYFVGGAVLFAAELYSVCLLSFIAVRSAIELRKKEYYSEDMSPDIKPCIAALSVLLFAMVRIMAIKFVDSEYVAWSLIPTAVITVAVALTAYFLLKDFISKTYVKRSVKILKTSLVCLAIFIVSFIYCFTAVATINCVFDGDPTPTQYAVLDKKANTGSTTHVFEIKIKINGETVWIKVPPKEYYELKKGDAVTLDYYGGALGFAYWQYAGRTQQPADDKQQTNSLLLA